MRSTERTVKETVLQYLQKYNVGSGSGIIVALSGGSDSTALLSVLTEIDKSDLFPMNIRAAYYNHRLRDPDELSSELEKIRMTAEKTGVQLITGSAEEGEIRADAEENKRSLEDAARSARYRFLFRVKTQYGADWIATGHNLNDNSETMLMRFLQNAGTAGLSGIPYIRDGVIRPLSLVGREKIEAYLQTTGLVPSIDTTNLETDFLRNRIRHLIMPAVKLVFPEVDGNLRSMAEKISLENKFLNDEASKRLKWEQSDGSCRIKSEDFYRQPLVIRIKSVFAVMNELGEERISYAAVKQAVSGEAGNGRILLRISGLEIAAADDYIFIRRLVNRNKKSYLLYLKTGEKQFLFGQKFIIFNGNNVFSDKGFQKVLLEAYCKDSLIIRSLPERRPY